MGIGLEYRGQLPEVVERELEALIARIKSLITQEHSDAGEHEGLSYSGPLTHITVVNGIVTGVS